MAEIYGPNSKRLASKYYQKANCYFNLNKYDEAQDSIEQAINLHDNPLEKD